MKWSYDMELKKEHLKKCKKPQFKSGLTQQFRIKIDSQIYKVYQSEKSYSVAKRQAGYVCILEVWYKLPIGWTSAIEGD